MTDEALLELAEAYDDDVWLDDEPPEPSRCHSPAERLAWEHWAAFCEYISMEG